MSSTKPKESTIKVLFALSGNECAFTDCTTKLVQDKNNLIGEICHIEARRPDGARYNKYSNDQARREISNLIILCPTHHKIIDNDENTYTVQLLKEMKRQHEFNCKGSSIELNDRELGRLMHNSGYYSVNLSWWRSTMIYNALSKLYQPLEIKASKGDSVKFEILGEEKKIVISTEVDANSVHGSLYEIERLLNREESADSFNEVMCFVFCNGLVDGRYSKGANHIKLKKRSSDFFRALEIIQQRYNFKVSFVFLLEDESHDDKFVVLPLISDCQHRRTKCECVSVDLATHYNFQIVNSWDAEVVCGCMQTRVFREYT